MSVTAVLLLIVKILWYLLMGVAALALLILLAVCFVPIRYDIVAQYKDKCPRARVRVHWLLKLLHVRLDWKEDRGRVVLRICGIKAKKQMLGAATEETATEGCLQREEGPAAEEPTETKKDIFSDCTFENEKESAKVSKTEEKFPQESEAAVAEEPSGDAKTAEPEAGEPAQNAESETAENAKTEEAEPSGEAEDKDADFFSEDYHYEPKAGLGAKVKSLPGKIKEKIDWLLKKKKEIEDFLANKKNQRAISLIRRRLKRLGRHLLPKKFFLEGTLGFDDPAKTGEVIGLIYALYPIYRDAICLRGNFEEEELDGRLYLRGRIRIGALLGFLLRLYLNRTIRRWIKDWEQSDDISAEEAKKEA